MYARTLSAPAFRPQRQAKNVSGCTLLHFPANALLHKKTTQYYTAWRKENVSFGKFHIVFAIKDYSRSRFQCQASKIKSANPHTGLLTPQNHYSSLSFPALNLQIPWVIVPIGQNVHQVLGLYSPMTTNPSSKEVSIRL